MSQPLDAPSLSPTHSFSGSPPIQSLISSAPRNLLQAVPPAETRISDTALAKLASLTEFLPTPADPNASPIAGLLTDTNLCEALKEIDTRILRFLQQKGLSDNGLGLILGYCPALQSLNLSGFHDITEAALPRIAELRQLTTLNLSATDVKHLGPLIERPLPHLSVAKFFETPVEAESLAAFLQRHKITNLTLPKNLPPGFLLRCPSDHLTEVTLQMNLEQNSTGCGEVLAFLQQTRIKKLNIHPKNVPIPNIMELVGCGAQLGKEVTFILNTGTISYIKC